MCVQLDSGMPAWGCQNRTACCWCSGLERVKGAGRLKGVVVLQEWEAFLSPLLKLESRVLCLRQQLGASAAVEEERVDTGAVKAVAIEAADAEQHLAGQAA